MSSTDKTKTILTAPRLSAPRKKSGRFASKKESLEIKSYYESISWKLSVLRLAVPKFIKKLLLLVSVKRAKKEKKKTLKSIKPKPRSLKFWGVFLTINFTFFFMLGIWFWQNVLKDLPSPEELTKRSVQVSTKIYDREGVLLYTIYKDENRTPIPFDKIPVQVRAATVASEDAQFYSHPGFSIRGIIRSIITNIRNKKLTGGSTITQQLVKNALLTPEKTIPRKLKEIILSIQVERVFSKDQILEMYLNEVAYGGTVYGIQEAALSYFGKEPKSLTLAEAALLASLPQSPTKYSPFGSNPEVSVEKKNEVLKRMFENGFITKQQELEAINENIVFSQNKTPIIAPHFVFYVRDLLEEKYGKEVVQEGGLNVVTSLDYNIQKLAESVVASEVDKLKSLNVTNAAVVVLNPKTGEVLAMVGSRDYFDTANDGQVNVTLRPRQPGSSIKVVNYAYALGNGLTPAIIIPDTPTTFKVEGQEDYVPKNYDEKFRGNISLRSALAESRNIPAVKVLSSYGVEHMVDLGTKMGITTWDNPKNYGLSLTLGGGEVRLIDLAQVYATVADYGNRPDINPILSVTNFNGKTLEEFNCVNSDGPIKATIPIAASTSGSLTYLDQDISCGGPRIIKPEVAYLLTNILKDNNARSPAFGTNSFLNIKNHPEVAVKTGTSNDLRDNLTVGYTRDYLVAVWIGNNDNSEMSRVASGVTGATPIFNNIMSALLADKDSYEWPVPEGLIQLPICPLTGTLACQGCPLKMEWFLESNKPGRACSNEWFQNQNIQEPVNNQSDIIPTTSPSNNYFETQVKEKLQNIKKKIVPPGRKR